MNMNLLVCIAKVPDSAARIAFDAAGNEFDTQGVQYIMNPYDEWNALVRALELKEANGGKVTVINVGPPSNDATIRKALAIGADDAVRINMEPKSAMAVAKQIAEYAKDKNYDIIFTGKETIEFNGSEVPAMIAEFMNLPFVSFGSNLEVAGNTAVITRDIVGGTETDEVPLPVVVSAAKGMAEQRIPNMRGIMMAKRKPLAVVEPVAFEDAVAVVHYELPPAKSAVKLVDPDNMDELARLLHEEAKVI